MTLNISKLLIIIRTIPVFNYLIDHYFKIINVNYLNN